MAQKKDFSHVEIIAAIASDSHPVISLKLLADDLGCSEQTLLPRLLPLVESGRVIRYDLGTKGKPLYVYYLPEEK